MPTFFEKNNDRDFRNFIPYPLPGVKGKTRNCCGFAATGDAAATDAAAASDTTVKSTVTNMTAWHYAKTALAILGLYVAVKYAWGKLK